MGIKIVAEKEVLGSGEQGWRIKFISALPEDKLPLLYTARNPSCWLSGCDLMGNRVGSRIHCILSKGSFYCDQEFTDKLKCIRDCGDRLHENNKTLAAKRVTWTGTETYII